MSATGRVWICSFCRSEFTWREESRWFGSYHDLEKIGAPESVWCGSCPKPGVDELEKAEDAR